MLATKPTSFRHELCRLFLWKTERITRRWYFVGMLHFRVHMHATKYAGSGIRNKQIYRLGTLTCSCNNALRKKTLLYTINIIINHHWTTCFLVWYLQPGVCVFIAVADTLADLKNTAAHVSYMGFMQILLLREWQLGHIHGNLNKIRVLHHAQGYWPMLHTFNGFWMQTPVSTSDEVSGDTHTPIILLRLVLVPEI